MAPSIMNLFVIIRTAVTNKKVDRDENAMLNLIILVKHPELNKAL